MGEATTRVGWADRGAVICSMIAVPVVIGHFVYITIPVMWHIPGIKQLLIRVFLPLALGVSLYSIKLAIVFAKRRESFVTFALARNIFFTSLLLTTVYELFVLLKLGDLSISFGIRMFGFVESLIGRLALWFFLQALYTLTRGDEPKFTTSNFMHAISFRRFGEPYVGGQVVEPVENDA